MIDFSLALSTLIHKHFTVKKLSGHEKVLIVGALVVHGDTKISFDIQAIKSQWSKSILGIQFSRTYVTRAIRNEWIYQLSKSEFRVTKDGYDHLNDIDRVRAKADSIGMSSSQGLMIFRPGETHSFDKHLRQLLESASSYVRIVDSYVNGRIFDTLLDKIPKTARIRLLYNKAYDDFEPCAQRFNKEFVKFKMKNNNNLHDRFLIVDSAAYIIGPSLKDAAEKSPATLVKLGAKDSETLINFFDEYLWKSD